MLKINALNTNKPIKDLHLELANSRSVQVICIGFFIAIVAHFIHLPIWVSGLILFSLTWRLAQSAAYIPPLPRWIIVPLVIAGGVGVFATYWTISGRDAGLALLSVMASFKLLESHTQRDALIVVFLSYFLVATHFLFSQSILIALYMILTILFLTASLITLNDRDNSINWPTRFKISGSMIAYSIPLMLILFVLVPRVPGPLWGLTHEQRAGVTGLSDSMSPGKISDLIQDNSVAFRVSFDGDIPPQRELYWRGPVMSLFNGQTWFQTTQKSHAPQAIASYGSVYSYTTTIEANGKKWLLPLDLPKGFIKDSSLSSDFELKSTKLINDLKKYNLQSYSQATFGLDTDFETLIKHTQYSDTVNQKTIAYGKQLRAQFDDDAQLVSHVLKQFREQEFFYTLSPPLLNNNPVDDFLFNTKRGFCEHYASSFALLMRAADIPSRIVTGYQGGEFNDDGQYLIIRQSDAHAWTEIWLEDKGWIRIDPTAAVSPDRIEKSLEQALSNENFSFRIQNKNSLLGNLLFSWDNVQHQWNNMVLNYNQQKQSSFLKKLGIGIQSTADMVIALVLVLTLLTLSYVLLHWYRHKPEKPEYFEQLFLQLLSKTKKQGYPILQAESPSAYLDRVNKVLANNQLAAAIQLYNLIKYSHPSNKQTMVTELKEIISTLKI